MPGRLVDSGSGKVAPPPRSLSYSSKLRSPRSWGARRGGGGGGPAAALCVGLLGAAVAELVGGAQRQVGDGAGVERQPHRVLVGVGGLLQLALPAAALAGGQRVRSAR